MLTISGLVIICIAWLYELYLLISKGDMMLSVLFVGIYTLGVLMLVVDGFMLGASSVTWLNLVSLLLSAGILLVLMKKK